MGEHDELLARAGRLLDNYAEIYVGKPYSVYDLAVELEAALRAATAAQPQGEHVRIRPVFAWFDLWVGVFIDRPKRRVYIFPLPCLGVVISWAAAGSVTPTPEARVAADTPKEAT